jgi:hypothetical protein
MTIRKALYVNVDGDYEEASGVYETSDHINVSTGVADAGKPIVLDAAGVIDSSMIDLGAIDHGSLGGLLDDDHTQYLLVSGTRAMTGALDMGTFKVTNMADGSADTDAVTYRQLINSINGIDWKESARLATQVNINLASAPATIDGIAPSNGDRILVKSQTAPAENGIYIYNGAAAAMTRSADADEDSEVTAMMTVGVSEGTVDADRIYTVTSNDPLIVGTSDMVFGVLPVNTFVGGDGIEITGTLISVDLLASGGLKFVGGELAVEPADFAGNGLVDDGADNLAIDFAAVFTIDAADAKAIEASKLASTTNAEGASIIGVEDASAYYAGTDLESVLNELEGQLGGLTSSTFAFAEQNVLADNDAVYPALEKLDLKFGDLASVSTGEGASLVGVEDAAGNLAATNVEAALAEIYTLASVSTGEVATVDGVGVTKGDLLYYTAANTVSTMPINAANRCVGVALETVAAAGTVKYARWDELVAGVLTGASFGDRYYWDGSALTATIPSAPGQYVWQAGIAKNSTDLLATVEFVKKNI